jgi:hypothetical protein
MSIPDITKVPTSDVPTVLAWALGVALLVAGSLFGLLYRVLSGQIATLRKNLEESNRTCDARIKAMEDRYDARIQTLEEQYIERLRSERDRAHQLLNDERVSHRITEANAIVQMGRLRERVTP